MVAKTANKRGGFFGGGSRKTSDEPKLENVKASTTASTPLSQVVQTVVDADRDDEIAINETMDDSLDETYDDYDDAASNLTGDNTAAREERQERQAHDLLERYGFGSGMRMYAKSVALAAQVEREQKAKAEETKAKESAAKEQTAKEQAAAEAASIEEASGPATTPNVVVVATNESTVVKEPILVETVVEDEDGNSTVVAPAPVVAPVMNLHIPSFQAACSRESVKQAIIQKGASTTDDYTDEEDVDGMSTRETDDESAYTKGSVFAMASGNKPSSRDQRHGESALAALFRQAEEWAASTHDAVFLCGSHEPGRARIQSAAVATSKKTKDSNLSWWNWWGKSKKSTPLAEHSLSLDEAEPPPAPPVVVVETKTTAPAARSWWSSWFSSPATVATAADEAITIHEPTTQSTTVPSTISVDCTIPTSNEKQKRPLVAPPTIAEKEEAATTTPAETTDVEAGVAPSTIAEPLVEAPITESEACPEVKQEETVVEAADVVDVANKDEAAKEAAPEVAPPTPPTVDDALPLVVAVGDENETIAANKDANEAIEEVEGNAEKKTDPVADKEAKTLDAESTAVPAPEVVEETKAAPVVEASTTTTTTPVVVEEPKTPVTTKWCLW